MQQDKKSGMDKQKKSYIILFSISNFKIKKFKKIAVKNLILKKK